MTCNKKNIMNFMDSLDDHLRDYLILPDIQQENYFIIYDLINYFFKNMYKIRSCDLRKMNFSRDQIRNYIVIMEEMYNICAKFDKFLSINDKKNFKIFFNKWLRL